MEKVVWDEGKLLEKVILIQFVFFGRQWAV